MDVELSDAGDPLLDQFSMEGFVDCIFRISDHRVTGQYHRFQCLLRIAASPSVLMRASWSGCAAGLMTTCN
ncbi:MAG: hypothetical protein R3F05_16165 [Planctomycetota bacterium]